MQNLVKHGHLAEVPDVCLTGRTAFGSALQLFFCGPAADPTAGAVEYRGGVVATLTIAHQPEAVEALERRLLEEICTAELSGQFVCSEDRGFEIQKVLGHGASSVVCRALQTKLRRQVAIKLFPGLADGALARAVRSEAHAVAKVSHANIITVFDYDVLRLLPGGHLCFYVAMELGQPLRDWLREAKPSQAEIVATFIKIGEGLAAIHAAGFVYRDFKPENVVLVHGAPKIVDFGLALSAATQNTGVAHRIVGTPAFMSPEALSGRPQDPRSDQFSFAAALWKALCSEFPYDERSHDPAVRGVLRPPAVPLLPTVLSVLRRALALAPEQRFPDMLALLAALAQPATGPTRSWSAAARDPAWTNDVDATTELAIPKSARARRWPWLAVPVVAALVVGGVFMALGMFDDFADDFADEAAVVTQPAADEVAPMPAAGVPACPDLTTVVGQWQVKSTAERATSAKYRNGSSDYTLDIRGDGTPCGIQIVLTKLSGDAPRRDEQSVIFGAQPPFTGGFGGDFAPRKHGQASADYAYTFEFIVSGDQLYGAFDARVTASSDRFAGTLRGARGTSKPPSPNARFPCTLACTARCRTAARAACRRACVIDPWADATCPAAK